MTTNAGDDTLAINADVRNGSAVDIAGAINAAAIDEGIDDYISASANGGVVTIKNSFGAAVAVDAFSAEGAGTATYTTVNGGVGSDSVVNLAQERVTLPIFNTRMPQHVAASDATSGTAAVFIQEIDGFTDTLTDGTAGEFGTDAAHIEVDFGDYSVTVLMDADTIGNFAAAVNAEQNAYHSGIDTMMVGD